MTNTKKDQEVKFNFINLAKKKSLFNYGVQIIAFSETKNKQQKINWFRAGHDIKYYKSNIVKVVFIISKCFNLIKRKIDEPIIIGAFPLLINLSIITIQSILLHASLIPIRSCWSIWNGSKMIEGGHSKKSGFCLVIF